MPNFRRYYIPDSLVFITSVTNMRYPFLEGKNAGTLYAVMNRVKLIHPYEIVAYSILPDHFHWIILPQDARGDFSTIMHSVKLNFSRQWRKENPDQQPIKLWQNRFWDHVIRDEDDLSRHIDYIHWNSVKHQVALKPDDWKASSFQIYVDQGYYESDWGSDGEPKRLAGINWE